MIRENFGKILEKVLNLIGKCSESFKEMLGASLTKIWKIF